MVRKRCNLASLAIIFKLQMLVLHVLAFSPAEVLIQKRVSLVRIYFGDKLLELPFKLLVKTVEGNGNVCLPVFIF